MKKNRNNVELASDIWFHVAKFVKVGKLPELMVLSKRIHVVVDSDFSWKQRCIIGYPPDQIKLIERLFTTDSFHKSIFRELRFGFRSRRGDYNPTVVTSKYIHRNYENTKTVHSSGLCHYSYDAQVDESKYLWNRVVDRHISEWFSPDNSSSTTSFLPSVVFDSVFYNSVDEENINLDEDVGLGYGEQYNVTEFCVGQIRYQFFPANPFRNDSNNEEIFCSSCNVSVGFRLSENNDQLKYKSSDEEINVAKEKFFFTNGVGLFIHPDSLRVRSDSFLNYGIGREIFCLNVDVVNSQLKNLLYQENDVLSKPIFECEEDVFKDASTSFSFRGDEGEDPKILYQFKLTYQKFDEAGSFFYDRKLQKKEYCGKVDLEPVRDEEAGIIFYQGSYFQEGGKNKSICQVVGSGLEKYISFSFVDSVKKVNMFYLGGKVLFGGRKITGFLYDPSPQSETKVISGVFIMTKI